MERLTVLVSRLRGLSRFQVSNAALGLSTQELDSILDTVSCIQLVAHQILIASGLELRQFLAFSAWLRQEIQIQATGVSLAESTERDLNVDHASTLDYIQGAMSRSQLTSFFGLKAKADEPPHWNLSAEGRSLFGLFKRGLKYTSKEDSSNLQLPNINALINYLEVQCSTVFNKIAETQRRNVRFGAPVALENGQPACMDMRMIVDVYNT